MAINSSDVAIGDGKTAALVLANDRQGDQRALEQLTPLVNAQLRAMAGGACAPSAQA
jgi:hypothetical protein